MTWNLGSTWQRWDPHIHSPGTLRNNGFGSDWSSYLEAIESATPAPCALGITDYYTLRGYRQALNYKREGRLSQIPLLFPNVEFRLTVETKKGQGINFHLLVSPEDPNHVELLEGILSRLQFSFQNRTYQCTERDLIRLGRDYNQDTSLPELAAMSVGANQFKVNWQELRRLRDEDDWIRRNVLFAVAAGEDGLSGLSKDAAFAAERDNLARLADVIFSSNASDRKYWGGGHSDFAKSRQRTKPCLHGCDAHSLQSVLAPAEARLCWVKGEPTFETLRQTLVEPIRRVYVGSKQPGGPPKSQTISAVTIRNAPWLPQGRMPVNPGLVTIIGAKGSGKTALADLIAAGALGRDPQPGPASFLEKAKNLLGNTVVEIEWADQTITSTECSQELIDGHPRVRYLSQQFVERLCSAQNVSEPLLEEIEAVVFSSLSEDERLDCQDFSSLRELSLGAIRSQRDRLVDEIREITKQILSNQDQAAKRPTVEQSVQALTKQASSLNEELEATKGIPKTANAEAYQQTSTLLANLRRTLAKEERKSSMLVNLKSEIAAETKRISRKLSALKDQFDGLGIDWSKIVNITELDPEGHIDELLQEIDSKIQRYKSHGLDGQVGLELLQTREKQTLQALGVEKEQAERRSNTSKKLNEINKQLELLRRSLDDLDNKSAASQQLRESRQDCYRQIFESFDKEQNKLTELYGTLSALLEGQKLQFCVRRNVDLRAWCERGELLLDLRRPPFCGRGSLEKTAREVLLPAWQGGDARSVVDSVQRFVEVYGKDAIQSLASGVTRTDFAEWVFSVDHIRVDYDIKYEGVSLPQLSPGTRGIVLLTLYLALDYWDDRPLIIDQPEENLDPRSVYSDLVPFFRDASERRQIIMVTHNANLVVNTDSDQVVVAASSRESPDELPLLTYIAGGLESPEIREQVCVLLEGGKDAFRQRGMRYGGTEVSK